MTTLLKVISFIGLGLSIIPSLLVFAGHLEMQTNLRLMVVGMLLWFGSAVFWIKPDQHSDS